MVALPVRPNVAHTGGYLFLLNGGSESREPFCTRSVAPGDEFPHRARGHVLVRLSVLSGVLKPGPAMAVRHSDDASGQASAPRYLVNLVWRICGFWGLYIRSCFLKVGFLLS